MYSVARLMKPTAKQAKRLTPKFLTGVLEIHNKTIK